MRHCLAIAAFLLLLYSLAIYSSAQTTPVTTLPPPSNGQPFEVSMGLYLMHIVKIDQPNQILTGLFETTMLWQDARVAYQSPDGSPKVYSGAEADKVLSAMWSPDPEIINQASKPGIQKNSLTIFPDGSIAYRKVFSADILTEFDYTRFPFDDQELKLEFQSFAYNSNELVFIPSDQYTGISSLFRSDDWVAYPISVFAGFKRAFGYETQDSSYILYEIKLERRSLFYILRIILPFCFFILMTTSVFWIHETSIDRRISIVVTLMLTSVAFNFLVLNYLPSVPYKTMLNAIISAGYFMSGILIATIVALNYFKNWGSERVCDLGNTICRALFPIFMIGVWLIIYYVFNTKELQIVDLVK